MKWNSLKTKKLSATLLVGIIIGIVVTTTYTYANGTNDTFTISQGIYPGAPAYTVWLEDSTYYAKNSYGNIDYYDASKTTVIQNCNDALTSGGTIFLSGIEVPIDLTISSNVQIIERYDRHEKVYSSINGNTSTIYPRNKIAEVKEIHSWTNLDAEQGVCTDGIYVYVTETSYLSKWTMDGTRLYNVDPFNGRTDVSHAGDCEWWDGSIWVTCSDFTWNGSDPLGYTVKRRYIYEYSATDLSYIAIYNVTTTGAPEGVEYSGISYWNTSFVEAETSNVYEGMYLLTFEKNWTRLFQFNDSLVYQNEFVILPDIRHGQGVTFLDEIDQFYITCYILDDMGILSDGKLLVEFMGGFQSRVMMTQPYEGLDIDPLGQYIWICSIHSAGDNPLWQMYFYP